MQMSERTRFLLHRSRGISFAFASESRCTRREFASSTAHSRSFTCTLESAIRRWCSFPREIEKYHGSPFQKVARRRAGRETRQRWDIKIVLKSRSSWRVFTARFSRGGLRSPIEGDGVSSSRGPRETGSREDFRRRNRVYTLERLSPVSPLGDPLIYGSYREFCVLPRLRLTGVFAVFSSPHRQHYLAAMSRFVLKHRISREQREGEERFYLALIIRECLLNFSEISYFHPPWFVIFQWKHSARTAKHSR